MASSQEGLLWLDEGTDHASIIAAPISLPTAAPSIASLTERAGYIRTRARLLHADSDELHERTKTAELNERTREWARQGVPTLLDSLSELGFAWRDVARMVGVSVPAIRKWRNGERATGENRQRLAALVAGCSQISDDYEVSDVASWFETPIHFDAPVTPIDLWVAQRSDLVLEHASGHSDSEWILAAHDPEWRETYRTDFESFIAADGDISIRPKS